MFHTPPGYGAGLKAPIGRNAHDRILRYTPPAMKKVAGLTFGSVQRHRCWFRAPARCRPEAGAPSRPRASCRSAVRGSRPSGFRGCRSYDRRGVAPSPTLRPKAETPVREHATEAQRCQRISSTVTSEGYAHRYAIKGGLTYFRTNVAPTMTPARTNYSRKSGRCRAWSKTPGRAPMHGGGAALS